MAKIAFPNRDEAPAGVRGRTLIVNLPGSTGGVKDGLGVLDDVLEHALDQLAGKDHSR
jgi:molybdopterin biosynthesis enzyme MoaB